MLVNARVAARLPAQDLDRARRILLGEARAGARRGTTRRVVVPRGQRRVCAVSLGRNASGTFTQIAFEVDDQASVMREPKRRGVVFEDVDSPGLRTIGGVAEVEGNYPSQGGKGECAAWFRDSKGNLLGVGQPL